MPLITSSWETLKDDIKNAPSSEVIVVFSGAKNEEGKSWCPPCNAAAPSYKSNLEDNADVHALLIPVEPKDFGAKHWPMREWAAYGVPILYRLKDGELSGSPLVHEGPEFNDAIEYYAKSEDEYEAWALKTEGDEYIDPVTRFQWQKDDFARYEEQGKAARRIQEERKKVRAEQAAKRKAAAPSAEAEPKTVDSVEKATVCNGVSCSA